MSKYKFFFYNQIFFVSLVASGCGRGSARATSSAGSATAWSPTEAYEAYAGIPLATRAQFVAEIGGWSPMQLVSTLAGTSLSAATRTSTLQLQSRYPTLRQLWAASGVDPTRLDLADFRAAGGEANASLALTIQVTLRDSAECRDVVTQVGKKFGVSAVTVMNSHFNQREDPGSFTTHKNPSGSKLFVSEFPVSQFQGGGVNFSSPLLTKFVTIPFSCFTTTNLQNATPPQPDPTPPSSSSASNVPDLITFD